MSPNAFFVLLTVCSLTGPGLHPAPQDSENPCRCTATVTDVTVPPTVTPPLECDITLELSATLENGSCSEEGNGFNCTSESSCTGHVLYFASITGAGCDFNLCRRTQYNDDTTTPGSPGEASAVVCVPAGDGYQSPTLPDTTLMLDCAQSLQVNITLRNSAGAIVASDGALATCAPCFAGE